MIKRAGYTHPIRSYLFENPLTAPVFRGDVTLQT